MDLKIKEKLVEILGEGYVSDSDEQLEAFSGDNSLTRPRKPNYLARPENTEQVQKVIMLAGENRIPVIPCSSGVHFNGCTVPKQGGIILDLRRMNKILKVDDLNRRVWIEPGVTWQQLQIELKKQDMMVISPLLPHPQKSVVTTFLERDVPLITRYEYGDPLQAMQVVWPNGDIFRTGTAAPEGFPNTFSEGTNPQSLGNIDFNRLIQGSQGTMGVVTWAFIKTEYRPRVNKTYFVPLNRIEDAIEPLYRILRQRIGHECFILNNLNMAIILSKKWPGDFERLRKILPPWTMVFILSGLRRRPEEKVAYEEEALWEIRNTAFPDMELLSTLPGALGLENDLPDMLRSPWTDETTYWKSRYRGASQDLLLISKLSKVPEFTATVNEMAIKHGCNSSDIGSYIQPLEYGAGCHCEFNFYYNPGDSSDMDRVTKLYTETAETLLDRGALYTRPYGILADLVYSRASEYTAALKKVKDIFDPDNIMCPGNLCF